MIRITIREKGTEQDGPAVAIDEIEYPIAELADPFSDDEEQRLAWYFEEHLEFPFTDQVEARRAAESVEEYGHRLFEQVFSDNDAYAAYKAGVAAGWENLLFEVVGTRSASVARQWRESGDDELIARVAIILSVEPDEVKTLFDEALY